MRELRGVWCRAGVADAVVCKGFLAGEVSGMYMFVPREENVPEQGTYRVAGVVQRVRVAAFDLPADQGAGACLVKAPLVYLAVSD